MTESFLEQLTRLGVTIRNSKSGLPLIIDFRSANLPQTHPTELAQLDFSLLAEFERLKEIYLDGMPITDDQLSGIARLPRLQTLSLLKTPISEVGIELLQETKSLKLLQLSSESISAEFLARFRKRMIQTRIVVQ
jgi:Leucine-rich repeat (LRR) protein